jgi:hypothetical protein
MFTKDFKELLSVFNAHQVKYLIVGVCCSHPRAAARHKRS